jgi:hypothetical protein
VRVAHCRAVHVHGHWPAMHDRRHVDRGRPLRTETSEERALATSVAAAAAEPADSRVAAG